MATQKINAPAIAKKLQAWNNKLKVEVNPAGDTVTATCRTLDMDYYGLKQLAELVGEEANIHLGRSGANFRMMIW